ncbi:MAG: hypothetical protein ACLQDV_16235 [Candidatus Binataceae bacterium]
MIVEIGDARAAADRASMPLVSSGTVSSPTFAPGSKPKTFQGSQVSHDLGAASSGIINVKAYGAKGDCQTDDTAALMRAKEAAYEANLCLYLPPACYRVTQLNWTDLDGFCAFGTGAGNWRGAGQPRARTMIDFVNPGGLVGLDTSGSSDMYLAGIVLKGGTSAADAPQVLWLHGKDTTGPVGGEAIEGVYERMVFMTFGPFGDYNVGNEQIHYLDSQWISSGVGNGNAKHGTRMQVFSTVNSFGVHSPWVTLRSDSSQRWASMSDVDIDGFGTQWTSNGDSPVTFDNAKPSQRTGIARIKMVGYVQLFGPNDVFVVDSATSAEGGSYLGGGSYLDRIDMDLMSEFTNPGSSDARLIDVKSTMRSSNIKLDMGWPGSNPTLLQPYLSFGGFRDSTLQVMPNVFKSKPIFSAADCQGSIFIGEIGPGNVSCGTGKYLAPGI